MKAPVVTTLHTVWPSFPVVRQGVFREVLRRSSKLIVFSEIAAGILRSAYEVAPERVEVIPHGVPDVPF
ncbi:MAG: glycosyltransferase [Verrucomicrobia bacterium]|nr:glycosyltransferase [Verrucomicrobiota bacterium]